ncbi:PAS domain S-box protein [Nocardioides eburneiflavus]|uniref:Sensor-like histidine kinase SenX3 n=2 Tax=Nocardioides eburneiflavus TaxID=2518372 RepID=A0A4Z1CPS4_9ACTN|nr:PAS domain S-box protein [Nocardioides eburneiflavus]
MRLESSGRFDVVGEAADGEEAIDVVIRHEPQAVLLDVSMPAMDGLETLPSILAVRPGTAVVMFSGFGGTDLAAEARSLGALDFIEKSIPLEQLADRLLQSLGGAGPASTESSGERPSATADGGDGQEVDVAQLEQAILDEHLEGFRALFDRAAIGMATLTVHATIVRANEALAELMSCQPSDLVGVDYGRLTGGRGDILDQHLESLHSSQGDVATFEHPVPAPTGARTARTALVTLVPIRDSTGRMLYVFAQVQDITSQRAAEDELRRTEETFRLLVAAVEDYAIFMLEPSGRVASWNAGARRIKGYEATEIVGRHFRVFYPEEDQLTGHPERYLEGARRDGSFAEEGWRVRRDGSRFWASVVITAVHDERGRLIGFAKVTRDQTEQRANADDRSDAMAELTRLLAVTAHELRTPTAVIDGSAHTLQTTESQMAAGERDQLLRGIRSSADRLRRLAADLTAASQLEGTGLRLERQSVSLAQLIRGAALRRATTSPAVHVEVDAADEARIHADEVRLAQALDNLIDNAVRHGAPPYAVSARVRDDEVELRVTDAGPGVPVELVPRVFDRFATAGPTSGTGLGLYLVREIARVHGGEVDYQPPADGSPTAFCVRFPTPTPFR